MSLLYTYRSQGAKLILVATGGVARVHIAGSERYCCVYDSADVSGLGQA